MKAQWTIGKKLGLGFGSQLIAFIILAGISISGVQTIVNNAKEVIAGNQLRSELVQREVDHLNWVNQVNALLTDNTVTQLNVETDSNKCAFGRWYHSPARQEAEKLIPALKPILSQYEEPHVQLHASAVAIADTFRPADDELGNFLREKKVDHLNWMGKIRDALLIQQTTPIDVQMDPTKCSLGSWLLSPQVNQLSEKYPAFTEALAKIHEPHRQLHESAQHLQMLLINGQYQDAVGYFNQNTTTYAQNTLKAVDCLLEWQDAQMAGLKQGNTIYATQTDLPP
ncbi:MAG: hypothetical protein HJJLKODD_01907 [Phycisphaerae bacterium]|nr:hypothetical protein [Phycisphaerae bacterium]